MDSISPRPSGLVRRPPRERRGPSLRDSRRSRNPLLPTGALSEPRRCGKSPRGAMGSPLTGALVSSAELSESRVRVLRLRLRSGRAARSSPTVRTCAPLRRGRPIVRDTRARLPLDSAILSPHHLVRFAQYAALSGPRAMFFAWRALKLLRRALCLAVLGELPAPLTPCCPKRIRRVCPPDLASTAWLLVGCPGVRLGRLCPLNRSPLRTSALLRPLFIFSLNSFRGFVLLRLR